jgi:hypothetical protein
MTPCSVCRSDDRAVIDKELMAGTFVRDLAMKYGLGKSAVHRHKAHVSKSIVKAAQRREERHGDTILDDARDLRSRTYALLDDAAAAKDGRAQVVLLAEIRQNIKLMGELTTPKVTEADTERALAWFSVEYDIPIDEMRAESKKVASIQADLLAGRTPPHTPPPTPFTQPWVPPPSPPTPLPVATPQSEAEAEIGGIELAPPISGGPQLEPPEDASPATWHLTI